MRIDKTLFGAVMALFTFSLVMSFSLSEYTVIYYGYNSMHFFFRQLAAIMLGILLITGLSRLDPDKWFVPIGFAVFILSLLAMMVMPFMPESLVKSVLGAKRWIRLGPISIAPVEFFKVGFVFFLGWSFSRRIISDKKLSLRGEIRMVFPYLLVLGLAVVLIAIFQKDLGQVAVLAVTLMVMFMFAGRSVKLFVSLLALGVFGFVGLVVMAPHRMARIKSWWSTVQDTFLQFFPKDIVGKFRVDAAQEPYQIANSLNAMKNSDLIGQGLGNGQFKLGYLSEVHTDFILSGLTEELGFLGLLVVVLLVLIVVFRLFKIAASVENPTYYLFSAGVGMLIIFAFIVNSYGISGLTPIKGIAVPFLSYGGSQILASSLAIGMVLMISKRRSR
jgi:cell division protein FtsW